MKRSQIGDLVCSLAGALAEVGDPWSLLIIKELMLRNRRFDAIAAQTGMSESSLAIRLKRLEAFGVIERRPYQARPLRHEYRLTPKGADLWPVLVTLTAWGDRWQGRGAPPLTYVCADCDGEARHRLVCEACDTALDRRGVRARASEAMTLDRDRRAPPGAPAPARETMSPPAPHEVQR